MPPADRFESTVGMLAYGSLIADPGVEIVPLIAGRIASRTPFSVEYARFSRTRGGAPTVVPHSFGSAVKAEVLILDDAVTVTEAQSLLWRRETRNEGSGKIYRETRDPNAVVIRDAPGFCDVAHVLYTDFNPEGKIANPDPQTLASAAIGSVEHAEPGKDGISYLIGLLEAGVETALTPRYVAEILARTGAADLAGALHKLQTSDRR